VVRMAVGQLRFTPEQLRDNIQAFLGKIKEDAEKLSFVISKEINEVVGTLTISSIIAHNWQVLSSTNSPGFSLTGEFRSEDSPPTSALSG
jgi:large subunit ribosomal protein L1